MQLPGGVANFKLTRNLKNLPIGSLGTRVGGARARARMAAAPAAPPAPRATVAVFGASWATPSTPLYDLSVSLGEALADITCDVISGGYGGTMEGVSLGATRRGARATGVLVPSLVPDRDAAGNAHLTARVDAPTLLTRIDAMLAAAPRFIVALPGTLGTLAELCAAWNTATLCPLRCVPTAPRPQ